jgi:hypothetical protein
MLRCTTDELFFSCSDSASAHFNNSANVSMLYRRCKPAVETCVDNTAKLRAAGASQLLKTASTTPRSYGRRRRSWHHGHVHATPSERRRGQRPVHHDQVHAWRLGHRPGHHDQIPAKQNERRRGQRPGRNDELPATHNERRREQWPGHHDHPTLQCSGFCSKLRAPHRGTPLGPFVCGARAFSLCSYYYNTPNNSNSKNFGPSMTHKALLLEIQQPRRLLQVHASTLFSENLISVFPTCVSVILLTSTGTMNYKKLNF